MTCYKIKVSGCDDSTTFEMDLNDDDAQVIHHLAEMTHEHSDYGCQPTLSITETDDGGDES